jgi:RNA polymerase sigma factor (sigma-70 family)
VETGPVADLVGRARDGDEDAWDGLVERYLGTVHAVCRAYRLADADAAEVNQVVWLRLAERLSGLRAPAAIGGWIAAATRMECLRRLRVAQAAEPAAVLAAGDGDTAAGEQGVAGNGGGTGIDVRLLVYERDRALLGAFDRLDPHSRRLLRLLTAEPRPTDDQVAAALDVPEADIPRLRARALDQLRHLMAP